MAHLLAVLDDPNQFGDSQSDGECEFHCLKVCGGRSLCCVMFVPAEMPGNEQPVVSLFLGVAIGGVARRWHTFNPSV